MHMLTKSWLQGAAADSPAWDHETACACDQALHRVCFLSHLRLRSGARREAHRLCNREAVAAAAGVLKAVCP